MKTKLALFVVLMLLLPLLSACGTDATPTTQPAAAPTNTTEVAGAPTNTTEAAAQPTTAPSGGSGGRRCSAPPRSRPGQANLRGEVTRLDG